MKRALALILIIAAFVVGFLSIRGAMPFLPVFGTSMEPEFKAGNIITIEEISPSDVKVGDIIVFEVPAAVREYYNYPPLVAHRVIRVNETNMTFRTKGDNVGEDPFTVRAQDIKGTVGQQIPYLGFPLLFFQSNQGLIFIITALSLFALYLYSSELGRGRQKVQRGIFAPIIQQNEVLAHRQEQTSQMSSKALEQFATAMGEYAGHLASHTAAVKDLASASQELKKGAVEQNQVLSHLMETLMERSPAKTEPPIGKPQEAIPEEHAAPKREEVVLRVERISYPPGCYREKHPAPTPEYKSQPTGCYKRLNSEGG